MDPEIVELRAQLVRVSEEFAAVQQTLRKLESSRTRRSTAIPLVIWIVVTLLALAPWGTPAQQVPSRIPSNLES
jgi:hypothetical protein